MDTQEKTSQPKLRRKSKAAQPQYNPNYAVAKVEQPHFDQGTGERLSTPRNVTYNEVDWLQFLEVGVTLQGWKIIEVVFLPKGWKQPEQKYFFKK